MSDVGIVTARAEARTALPASVLVQRIIDVPLPGQFFDWAVLSGVAAVEDQDGPWRTPTSGGRCA